MANQPLSRTQAAIYARSASHQELGQSYAIDAQISECIEYAQRRGYHVVDNQIYQEVWSGATLDRPQLIKLREAAKRGEFSLLIVRNIDRLSRSNKQVLELLHELKALSISIEIVHESLETTPWILMEDILASMKAMERKKMAKRRRRSTRHKGDFSL